MNILTLEQAAKQASENILRLPLIIAPISILTWEDIRKQSDAIILAAFAPLLAAKDANMNALKHEMQCGVENAKRSVLELFEINNQNRKLAAKDAELAQFRINAEAAEAYNDAFSFTVHEDHIS